MKMRTLVRCKARELILRCCGPPRLSVHIQVRRLPNPLLCNLAPHFFGSLAIGIGPTIYTPAAIRGLGLWSHVRRCVDCWMRSFISAGHSGSVEGTLNFQQMPKTERPHRHAKRSLSGNCGLGM